MGQISQLMIATGVLNLLVSIVYTVVVYSTLERAPALAGAVGFLLAASIILTEAWLGETILSVTVAEMKVLVLVAVTTAAIGITGITTVFEPTTN